MNALWMLLAAFWFALMAVGIKYASNSFSTFELVFYRGLISIAFMGTVMHFKGISAKTRYPAMHLWRSTVGVASLGCWFFAIAHLPLPTAMTLNYMSGIWIAAFIIGGSLLYGKQQPQGLLLLAVLMGFAGVILALRPSLNPNQLFAGLVGLLSGLGAALAYMQVSALGQIGEPEERTVLYFSIGSAVVGLLGMPLTDSLPWHAVSLRDALWIVPIGIFASLGQWSMTRAYRDGPSLVVASMQYGGIVFASIFSVVLFGDQIPLSGWAGIAIIIISGILATAMRTKALPDTPAEDH